MRIINATPEYFEKTVPINFSSSSTFLGHDILLWEPDNIARFYHVPSSSDPIRGIPISPDTFEVIVQDIRRRNEEIKQMLALGKSIFIFLPPPQKVYTANIVSVNLLDYFNFVQLQTTRVEGENITFRGDEPFTTFWETTKGHYVFKAQSDILLGKPLFFIDGTQVIIGSYLQIAEGHVVLLPTFNIEPNTPADKRDNIKVSFIDAIVNLTEALASSKGSENVIMPKWSINYTLPGERDLKTDVLNLEEELNTLQQKISHKGGLLNELDKNKLLFAGQGDSLEVEVRRVFEELGFTMMEVLPDRDDLILQYDDRIAVVEIKGILRKSAAERHAAQLEKWVSSYFSDKGIRPKGILVANAYCEIPLIERTEDAFPPQMRPYSEAREHCLITGLQLLCLYLDCKEDEEKKARMIHLLFNTKGVYSEYQDWSQFIEQTKTIETTS